MAIDADSCGHEPGFLAGRTARDNPRGGNRLAADHPDVLGELAVRIADEHAAAVGGVVGHPRQAAEHGGVRRTAAYRERAQHDVTAHQPILLAGWRRREMQHLLPDKAVRRGLDLVGQQFALSAWSTPRLARCDRDHG